MTSCTSPPLYTSKSSSIASPLTFRSRDHRPSNPQPHTLARAHTQRPETYKSLSSLCDPTRLFISCCCHYSLSAQCVHPRFPSDQGLARPPLTRTRERGRLIFMLAVLQLSAAAQKPMLSPIAFNWSSRL